MEDQIGQNEATEGNVVDNGRRRGHHRMRSGVHDSRNQTTREVEGVHEEFPVDFEPAGPLPQIAARPGFVQRWVRVRKGGQDDAQNVFAASRKGWTPRRPDTVPKHLQFMVVQREGIGGCIGTHDCVLMERHEAINAREVAYKRNERKARIAAVRGNLFSEARSIDSSGRYVTAPSSEGSARTVERGRMPVIQDDE